MKDAGVLDYGSDSSDDNDGDARSDVPGVPESADDVSGRTLSPDQSWKDYDVLDNGTAGTVLGVPAGADDQCSSDDNDQEAVLMVTSSFE